MLWELEIRPRKTEVDREAIRVKEAFGTRGSVEIRSGKNFLIEGAPDLDIHRASQFLIDPIVEDWTLRELTGKATVPDSSREHHKELNVLYKPGVTDNQGATARQALRDWGLDVSNVATGRKYWISGDVELNWFRRFLANDAIEQIQLGPIQMQSLQFGHEYLLKLVRVPIREMSEPELEQLSKSGQLYLTLVEMKSIQDYFRKQGADPTDIELETIAQTWSEHCSHKTLRGRISYTDENGERKFQNLLKETVFAATVNIRKKLGEDDFCVSVFEDNAGVVKFGEKEHVCIKVETHNHPSAIEPYGGANTGLGGVIRDPMGTGLGARPVCNTDVFCFAPPDFPEQKLPPSVLPPKTVFEGVVSGVRDYGNRMGIPTVNGAICFDERYLGNPLVYCGNIAMIPVDKVEKGAKSGDLIVVAGGKTGRDGIHGATFSSAELTEESESISGGAVQIGNAITEKMLLDALLTARDRGLYSAITDCGAGGLSSAVGEMAAELGAIVHLERAPLKYAGLSYTEIWISEAQERMVLAVPEKHWEEFQSVCQAEGVEATSIGTFTETGNLELYYAGTLVGTLDLEFLHEGRPPVVRSAVYSPPPEKNQNLDRRKSYDEDLRAILRSWNVCSKHWVIRQYDHEVQGGSIIKPLVGLHHDGPSDAAVVRPDPNSTKGLVISNGLNPHYGDFDPYWMAAAAIDEAIRNAVAVGADPKRIAILDNFCWGYTDRPETLGSLVRAALACREIAEAYGTPFVSGKDSLNNEFSYLDENGTKRTIAIPPTLLITALGQLQDFRTAVTLDLKQPGNRIFLIGETKNELGGSHLALIRNAQGGVVPKVNPQLAPKIFAGIHRAIQSKTIVSCHDLSEGGLAIALAEMAFSGGLGVEVSLEPLANPDCDELTLLFSESQTRFLVEVPVASTNSFLDLVSGLPVYELGTVTNSGRLQVKGGWIDASIDELKSEWQAPLDWN